MGFLKPSPPEAPDPVATAEAQGGANVEAAIASALLNQQNVVGPQGTVSFAQTGGQDVGGQFVPSFTRTTELTPEAQAQFEAQQQLGGSLTGLAQEQVGRIGSALGTGVDVSGLPGLTGPEARDFGDQAAQLEQATFQRGLGLLDPGFARESADIEATLVERGLPFQSEAARRARAGLQERQGLARENLALSSVGAGRQEQSRLFNIEQAQAALANAARGQGFQEQAFQRSLPIGDIAALLGTSPGVQQPQFQATPAFGVQAPDIIGSTFGAANLAQQQFGQQQQAQSGLLGGLFSLGSAALLSDRRAKTNIRPYGKTSKGFNLYKYIKNGIEEIGVMAQEVMQTMPEAVIIRNDGYYAVRYAMVI